MCQIYKIFWYDFYFKSRANAVEPVNPYFVKKTSYTYVLSIEKMEFPLIRF